MNNDFSAKVNATVMNRFANVTKRANVATASNGRLALAFIGAAAVLGLLTGCSSQTSVKTAPVTVQTSAVETPAPAPAVTEPAVAAESPAAPQAKTVAPSKAAVKVAAQPKNTVVTEVTVDSNGITRYPTLKPAVEAVSAWYAPTTATIGAAWGLGTPNVMFKDGAIYDNGSSITVVGLYGGPWRAMDLNDITGYTVKASSLGGHLVTVSCANGTTFQLTWGTAYDATSHPTSQVWRDRTTAMSCNA